MKEEDTFMFTTRQLAFVIQRSIKMANACKLHGLDKTENIDQMTVNATLFALHSERELVRRKIYPSATFQIYPLPISADINIDGQN